MSKYDPPHGILDFLFTWSDSGMARDSAENESYDRTWHNERGYQDYKAGEYSPPNGVLDDLLTWSEHGMKENSGQNEAYRSGWNEAKARDDAK